MGYVHAVLIIGALSAAAIGQQSRDVSSADSTQVVEIDLGSHGESGRSAWTACRVRGVAIDSRHSSEVLPEVSDCFPGAEVPGTAFINLLKNGSINTTSWQGRDRDPFFGLNLATGANDIADVGKQFYTLLYRRELPRPPHAAAARNDRSGTGIALAAGRTTLHLDGVSYRSDIFLNGEKIGSTAGMFRHYEFDVTHFLHGRPAQSSASSEVDQGGRADVLSIAVYPPDFPGVVNGSQGGDHAIAKNAAVSQFTAGWDWIRGTPDRNTGIWDRVWLKITGPVKIIDFHLRTRKLLEDDGGRRDAELELTAKLCNAETADSQRCVVRLSLAPPDANDVPLPAWLSNRVEISPNSCGTASVPDIILQNARLWWPHTHGAQPLYDVVMSVQCDQDVVPGSMPDQIRQQQRQQQQIMSTTFTSDSITFAYGIRTVQSYIHPVTGGRAFKVNNEDIFLMGGNWIATDQFMRLATSELRYGQEVRLHKRMGLNLIRVWGGGITERRKFYEACDREGVLVMQEFWMTGDNNGRWAGNYNWPVDHEIYLKNVEDVILKLRNHASLLFWCGGNELYPPGRMPAADILLGMQSLSRALDPDRLFLTSSMSNYTDYRSDFALAPKDGPYLLLKQDQFFERNPGLMFWNFSRADNLQLSFQPEIGSASFPVGSSLCRFLSKKALQEFPREGLRSRSVGHTTSTSSRASAAMDEWTFHNWLGFNYPTAYFRNGTPPAHPVDAVYAYGAPHSVQEYAERAQLVLFAQFRSLFEGYRQFMYEWYTSVIFWKSQSPWPVFRGAMYDSYLQPTGGFYGVAAATSPGLHLHLDLKDWVVVATRAGRSGVAGSSATAQALRHFAMVTMLDIPTGTTLEKEILTVPEVGMNQAKRLNVRRPLRFPNGTTLGVVLVRLEMFSTSGGRLGSGESDARLLERNDYWQSDWSDGGSLSGQDYRALGEIRSSTRYRAQLRVRQVDAEESAHASRLSSSDALDKSKRRRLAFEVRNEAAHLLAFAVNFELFSKEPPGGPQDLCFDSAEADIRVAAPAFNISYFTILPQDAQRVSVEFDAGDVVWLQAKAWNALPVVSRLQGGAGNLACKGEVFV